MRADSRLSSARSAPWRSFSWRRASSSWRWRSGVTWSFFRLRIGFFRSDTKVPWCAAGRNAAPYWRPPSISGPGPMAMKPGRFWFSVPRPYVTHAPRLGRVATRSPVFI